MSASPASSTHSTPTVAATSSLPQQPPPMPRTLDPQLASAFVNYRFPDPATTSFGFDLDDDEEEVDSSSADSDNDTSSTFETESITSEAPSVASSTMRRSFLQSRMSRNFMEAQQLQQHQQSQSRTTTTNTMDISILQAALASRLSLSATTDSTTTERIRGSDASGSLTDTSTEHNGIMHRRISTASSLPTTTPNSRRPSHFTDGTDDTEMDEPQTIRTPSKQPLHSSEFVRQMAPSVASSVRIATDDEDDDEDEEDDDDEDGAMFRSTSASARSLPRTAGNAQPYRQRSLPSMLLSLPPSPPPTSNLHKRASSYHPQQQQQQLQSQAQIYDFYSAYEEEDPLFDTESDLSDLYDPRRSYLFSEGVRAFIDGNGRVYEYYFGDGGGGEYDDEDYDEYEFDDEEEEGEEEEEEDDEIDLLERELDGEMDDLEEEEEDEELDGGDVAGGSIDVDVGEAEMRRRKRQSRGSQHPWFEVVGSHPQQHQQPPQHMHPLHQRQMVHQVETLNDQFDYTDDEEDLETPTAAKGVDVFSRMQMQQQQQQQQQQIPGSVVQNVGAVGVSVSHPTVTKSPMQRPGMIVTGGLPGGSTNASKQPLQQQQQFQQQQPLQQNQIQKLQEPQRPRAESSVSATSSSSPSTTPSTPTTKTRPSSTQKPPQAHQTLHTLLIQLPATHFNPLPPTPTPPPPAQTSTISLRQALLSYTQNDPATGIRFLHLCAMAAVRNRCKGEEERRAAVVGMYLLALAVVEGWGCKRDEGVGVGILEGCAGVAAGAGVVGIVAGGGGEKRERKKEREEGKGIFAGRLRRRNTESEKGAEKGLRKRERRLKGNGVGDGDELAGSPASVSSSSSSSTAVTARDLSVLTSPVSPATPSSAGSSGGRVLGRLKKGGPDRQQVSSPVATTPTTPTTPRNGITSPAPSASGSGSIATLTAERELELFPPVRHILLKSGGPAGSGSSVSSGSGSGAGSILDAGLAAAGVTGAGSGGGVLMAKTGSMSSQGSGSETRSHGMGRARAESSPVVPMEKRGKRMSFLDASTSGGGGSGKKGKGVGLGWMDGEAWGLAERVVAAMGSVSTPTTTTAATPVTGTTSQHDILLQQQLPTMQDLLRLSTCRLSECFERGIGVQKSSDTALYYTRIASSLGGMTSAPGCGIGQQRRRFWGLKKEKDGGGGKSREGRRRRKGRKVVDGDGVVVGGRDGTQLVAGVGGGEGVGKVELESARARARALSASVHPSWLQ
ncbi:hypothetical protein HDU97_007812 [Phlyctochytrium planicorne]|nr:hypothetical protein HDU97_007812 [Phlyctochytrium planicorne]